jgi:hypothetical protein
MTDTTTMRTNLEKNAQKYFRKTEQSETLAKQSRKKERNADAAKTAKLRGLRLAKEAADKEEADKLASQSADGLPGMKRAARRPSQPKRATVRMIY